MYRIIISRKAEKQLGTFPRDIANKIVSLIDSLAENPRPSGCKKMEGGEREYRVRTGDYRVVYTIEDNKLIVEVIKVGNRRDIYRKR